MNRLVSPKTIAAVALVLGTFGAASTAQARSDVQFSITFQTPGVYVQPAPVYVHPRPVYVQPAPVYTRPQPIYYAPPSTVYVYPYYGHDKGHRQHRGHKGQNQVRGPWGDFDRDGTPNRYDSFPGNPNRW